MRRTVFVLVGLGPALWAADAHAETATDRFEPAFQERMVEFPFDSGFVPAASPLQLQITAAAFQEVTIDLPGEARYDWDAATLQFVGDEGGAVFRNRLGAEVSATVGVDFLGITTQFVVGTWDIDQAADAENFAAYLLPGHTDRPQVVAQNIGPFNLVNTPFSIGGIDGTLNIDYVFDVPGLSFESTRIELDEAEGSAGGAIVSYDQEGAALGAVIGGDPGTTTTVHGTQYGVYNSALALHIQPTVSVMVMGVPLDIGPLDIVVDFPVQDNVEVVFDQLPIELDVPVAPDPGGTGGNDDGGDAGGTDGGDGGGDDAGDTGGGDDGGLTGGGGNSDDSGGCGCRADAPGPMGLLGGLLGLVVVTRRRRRQ